MLSVSEKLTKPRPTNYRLRSAFIEDTSLSGNYILNLVPVMAVSKTGRRRAIIARRSVTGRRRRSCDAGTGHALRAPKASAHAAGSDSSTSTQSRTRNVSVADLGLRAHRGERGHQVHLVTDLRALLIHAEPASMLFSRGGAAPSRLVSSLTHVRRVSARTVRAAVEGSHGAVSHRLVAIARTMRQRANSAHELRGIARCQSLNSMQSGVESARVRSGHEGVGGVNLFA